MSKLDQANLEALLAADIGRFTHDPLGFVRYAFPWGRGELAGKKPDDWQVDILTHVGRVLRGGGDVGEAMAYAAGRVVQVAIASGHGIGKSALLSWLNLWSVATCPDARGVVTANTAHQLKTKTWPELGKWHRLCICGHWFELTATALVSKFAGHELTWRLDAVNWDAKNPDAFAGLHNQGRRIILIFDEASSIHDKIWEVSEGALTDADTEIIWVAFGNPTKNTGRFRECFGSRKHRWYHKHIDSRTVAITNKAQIQHLVDDHGEDSDVVRVRVRGVFPKIGDTQFISSELAAAAVSRQVEPPKNEPLVMGIDVARFGDDQTIFAFRRGRDARCIPWRKFRKLEAPDLINKAVDAYNEYKPAAVFVDGGGPGGPVVDYLNRRVPGVVEVTFGGKADKKTEHNGDYANKRAEIWDSMRMWLAGGAIPDDQGLLDGLCGIEYGYDRYDRYLMESKESMKKRGLASPDEADALAVTFAAPVLSVSDRRGRPKFAEM